MLLAHQHRPNTNSSGSGRAPVPRQASFLPFAGRLSQVDHSFNGAPTLNAGQPEAQWPLRASGIGGAFALFVGAVVLMGWWLGVSRLVQPIPWLPGMVPNTAAAFVLLGTSLLLLRRRPGPGGAPTPGRSLRSRRGHRGRPDAGRIHLGLESGNWTRCCSAWRGTSAPGIRPAAARP